VCLVGLVEAEREKDGGGADNERDLEGALEDDGGDPGACEHGMESLAGAGEHVFVWAWEAGWAGMTAEGDERGDAGEKGEGVEGECGLGVREGEDSTAEGGAEDRGEATGGGA